MVESRRVRGRLTDLPEAKKVLDELLSAERFGVLCTQRKGRPYGTLVCFVADDDLSRILFATTRSTRKFSHMQADHHAALVVENTTNCASDIYEAVAATATGPVEELAGDERGEAAQVYLGKHPYLESFVTAPHCALMVLCVDAYSVVTRFQEVVEVRIGQ